MSYRSAIATVLVSVDGRVTRSLKTDEDPWTTEETTATVR